MKFTLADAREITILCDAERRRSNGLEQAMLRRLVCAGATILLITGAVVAQSDSNTSSPLNVPFKPKASPPTQEQIERQKTLDKAYEATIQKLPYKKSSADPWGDVRPAKAKSQ
jgi:hypothetical protein